MGDSHYHHNWSSQQRIGKSRRSSSSRNSTWSGSDLSSLREGRLPLLTDNDPQTFQFTDTSRLAPDVILPDSPSSSESPTLSPAGSSSQHSLDGIRRASGSSSTQRKNEEKTFRCERCPKSYKTSYNLSDHVKSAHENVKFPCRNALCREPFTSKRDANRHHNNNHLDKNRNVHPYVCKICGAHYGTNSRLTIHAYKAKKH